MLIALGRRLLLAMGALSGTKASVASGTEIARNYVEGERVEVVVHKLTSFNTLVSLDYDALPFCSSEPVTTSLIEQFGDVWAGDRKLLSFFRLHMRENINGEVLCVSNVDRTEQGGNRPNRMAQAICNRYRHHWSVDHGLPAGSRMELGPSYFETLFAQGFPMGFVGKDGHAYIYNHFTLEIYLQSVGDGTSRIVRFIVQPSSIHHDIEREDDVPVLESQRLRRTAGIHPPMDSCDPNRVDAIPLDFFMEPPQRASGKVLFTYDVIWTESRSIHWAYRWEIFLTNNYSSSNRVHVRSIVHSAVVTFLLLAGMVAGITRVMRQSVHSTESETASSQAAEDLDVRAWRAISADVFRPPSSSPMLLAVCCGIGAQLLLSVLLTVLSLYVRWLTPIQRGNLASGFLVVYVLCGSANGYVTSRMLKTFQCADWQRAIALAAFAFPAFVLSSLAFLKIIGPSSILSTFAVPLLPVLLLMLMLGLSALLILLGAYIGYQRGAIIFPVVPNPIPRPIPKQSWYSNPLYSLTVGGILPFSILYVELYYLMRSFWYEYYYSTFGFLLCAIMLAVINSVPLAMFFTAFQLRKEDYRWWWRSFFNGGAVSIYVFIYSFFYFQRLQVNSFLAIIIYYLYMGIFSIGLFFVMGVVGLASSLLFNIIIFTVKRHRQ